MISRVILILYILFVTQVSANEAASTALFIVHFESGAKWDKSLPASKQAGFSEHSANMKHLRDKGVIVFGARYGDLGMIIMKSASLQEVKSLLKLDPGVQSGIFNFRAQTLNTFYPWQM